MNQDEKFIIQAIEIAKKAKEHGNGPFGAVLVEDDKVIMTSENEVVTNSDPTAHAELKLIREYCIQNGISDLSTYTLYSSCEPCAMCSAAIVWAKLGRLVYSATNEQLTEILGKNIEISCDEIFYKSPNKVKVKKKVLNKEGLKILKQYKSK